MGNTPAKIGIRLDQNVVEAGNVLKGRVYLSIRSRHQQAQGIHLVLKGEEKSLIVKKETDHNRETRQRFTMSSTILHMDVPLKTFTDGGVSSGQYEYPFEWPLPDNIPSSMHCQRGDSNCSIEYQLTAYLDNSRSVTVLPDLSSNVTVTVLGFSGGQSHGIQVDLEEYRIKSCCADRGTISMGWDADTTVTAPKGVISVGITGKNDSIVDTKFLKVKLMETVTWSADGHTETSARQIASSEIYVTENALWKPLVQLPTRRERVRNHYDPMGGDVRGDVFQNRCSTQVNVSQDARDSYLGNAIGVRHSLTVTAVTPGGCCVTSPESSVLIKVQRRMPIGAVPTVATAFPQPSAPMFEEELIIPLSEMEIVSTYQDAPMAIAEILPEDWAPQESPVVTIPASSVYVQATASAERTTGSSSLGAIPSAPPASLLREAHEIARKLEELQSTLAASKAPTATLEQMLQNPVMVSTIQNLSPHEFVQTLKACSRQDSDYALNARMLASSMVPQFYCRHMLACLWSLSPAVRFRVLREVAPLASDISVQRESLERELDPTEIAELRAALT